jgi:hypothetical protein
MTGGGIWRLIERDFLAERWLHFVVAIRGRRFAFRRQAAERRLDTAGINRIQLFDVRDYLGDLRGEHLSFFVANFQVRQLRDFLDVGFGYRHKILFIHF